MAIDIEIKDGLGELIINEVLAPTDVFAVAVLSLREGAIYCEILGGEIARQ